MAGVGVLFFAAAAVTGVLIATSAWRSIDQAAQRLRMDVTAEYHLRQCGDLAAYRENLQLALEQSEGARAQSIQHAIALLETRLSRAQAWQGGDTCALLGKHPLIIRLRNEREVAEDAPNLVVEWQWEH